ncbi:hypothetical protein EGJ27_19915 [Pseudomonas sp. v388]|nr:hypothetical protein EGJ27_19915 [Pseudomonas sp. v388]
MKRARFFSTIFAQGPASGRVAILRAPLRYATVPKRMNETLPVTIVSKLLMRVIKAHARWRWRA